MITGKLIVISAPSGAGKTTLLKKVMSRIEKLAFSISHTTRSPRAGEQDGIDYHFVSRELFEKMIEDSLFIEYAEVHDNLYGTSSEAVIDQLNQGYDVILDIDVQGAAIIRESVKLPATYVFVSPPTLEELERRLRGRGTENEERVAVRLKNARIEVESASTYDYLIINDELDDAVDVFCGIVMAERAKARRLSSGDQIGQIV
jgi:guanylate kinase